MYYNMYKKINNKGICIIALSQNSSVLKYVPVNLMTKKNMKLLFDIYKTKLKIFIYKNDYKL